MSSLIFLIIALHSPAAIRPADMQESWAALEKRGAFISQIEIRILPVFNTQKPKENHLIGRSANFIHIETHEKSIRPSLLFKEGECVNALRIHASERLLRSLPSVRDAEIIPLTNPDGTATAIVKIRDAWSLKLSSGLRYTGGESEWGMQIREFNLLGFGKQVQVGYKKTIDRRLSNLAYGDPFLFNSRWDFSAEYQRLSDGSSRILALNHPFFDVRTPWAAGFTSGSRNSIQTFYERDKPVYDLPSRQYVSSVNLRMLVFASVRSALRLGIEYRVSGIRYDEFRVHLANALPFMDKRNRSFHGPLLSLEYFQDDYITCRNIQFIEHVEDFNLGWHASIKTGVFPKSWGSTEQAVYAEGSLQKGVALNSSRFLTGSSEWRGIRERGGKKHFRSQSGLTIFDQNWPHQTWMLSAQFSQSLNPYPEDVVYLGGTDGLRGYMNHFRIGDERWMFTAEDRLFTNVNFWGLFKLGFVAYFDAGAVRTLSGERWSKTYASVGAGLRIGNLKSSFGRVLSLTMATPLVHEPGVKGLQIVFSAGE